MYIRIPRVATKIMIQTNKAKKPIDPRYIGQEGEGEGGMIWENGNYNMYTVM